MAEGKIFVISPGGVLHGTIRVPGDKSISHRAVILGSVAEGRTEVTGFLEGEDTMATLRAFRALGVSIERSGGHVVIEGVGLHGLQAPKGPIDLGNSGTAIRLLSGLLAGQRFATELHGDVSLNSRPMRRIAEPLSAMGARVETSDAGTPPLRVGGVEQRLRPLHYAMPVPSAQVKSSVLLAGLYSSGEVCVREPARTRDHTERMLRGFGYAIEQQDDTVCLTGGGRLRGTHIEVPGDFSSAAFFIVGASIASGSGLVIESVGVNPTRTGAIEILRMMGAEICLTNERNVGGEPVADIRVRPRDLHGITIPCSLVSLAIDEFPALFVAAACARGETVLTGAQELRVKESDRIAVMARGLSTLGVRTETTPDGIIIEGGAIGGGDVCSEGDHRVAMAFSLAGLRAGAPIRILDCANVNTSFPGFAAVAAAAGLAIEVH